MTFALRHLPSGPIHLGWYTYINGTLAVIWVLFITCLFVLPTVRCFRARASSICWNTIGLHRSNVCCQRVQTKICNLDLLTCVQSYPVDSNNLNYAGVAVGVVLLFSFGWCAAFCPCCNRAAAPFLREACSDGKPVKTVACPCIIR